MTTSPSLLKLDKSPLVQSDSLKLRQWLALPERLSLEQVLKTRAAELMIRGAELKMNLTPDQAGHARADVDFQNAKRLMACLEVLDEIGNETSDYLVGTPKLA